MSAPAADSELRSPETALHAMTPRVKAVCPICKRELTGAPELLELRPFCSRRCKQIDLGNWLSERYRISEPLHESELEGSDASARRPLE